MTIERTNHVAEVFSKKFLSSLACSLNTRAYRKIISNTRVPNERELYGIVSSVLNSLHLSNDMPVLTEIAASRNENKGRIDFVTFNPSAKAAYLIELKVSRIAASHTGQDSDSRRLKRVQEPWENAIEQIQSLDDEEIRSILGLDADWVLAKIAVVAYFHVEYGDWNPDQPPEFKSGKNPSGVTEFILQQIKESKAKILASETVGHDRPLITRSRNAEPDVNARGVAIHGFSLIAGMD